MWIGATADGYGKLRVEGKNVSTHRLAWEWRHGPIPKGLLVCHSCDNRACIRPSHLFLGTNKENFEDAVRKGSMIGRKARGENHGNAKLKNEDIFFIRNDSDTHVQIGKRYGISDKTVSHIKCRDSWKHIPEEEKT